MGLAREVNLFPIVMTSGWSGVLKWILTIYGTGNMRNYGYSSGQPWTGKYVDIIAMVIEKRVAFDSSGAYVNLTILEAVVLSERLTQMGENSFYSFGLNLWRSLHPC